MDKCRECERQVKSAVDSDASFQNGIQ